MTDVAEMRMFENGLSRGREIGIQQERMRILDLLFANAKDEYRKVMLTPELLAEINTDKGNK